MIYLDNAATTKTIDSAAQKMLYYACQDYYNPSAGYAPALEVKKAIDSAKKYVASALNADESEIIFTSCATESNNTAFECGIKNKKGNVVISAMEHASVYESAMRLKSKGTDVRIAPLTKSGTVDIEKFRSLVDNNTAFVSVIHASNETGAINDIKTLRNIVKQISPNAVFHSDGVQAFCKTSTDLHNLDVDLYSISAHKIGGFKGVGILYVKKGLNIPAFIVGGGQQDSRRSGTENVGGIVSLAEAIKEYKLAATETKVSELRDYAINQFRTLDWAKINGLESANTGYVLSVSFQGLRGEVIAHMVEEKGIIIGLGSACSTHVKTNRVLAAMGLNKSFIDGSIRISFSPYNTLAEVEFATKEIIEAAKRLREVMNG